MNGDGVSTCVHCGRRVVKKNYALGEKWVHQPAGAAFDDYVEEFCQRTVATPVLAETPEVLTGQVPVSGNEEED